MSRFYTLCIDRKYRDILNEKINYIHKTTKKATTTTTTKKIKIPSKFNTAFDSKLPRK